MKVNKRTLLFCSAILLGLSVCTYFLLHGSYLTKSNSGVFQQVNMSKDQFNESLDEVETRNTNKDNIVLQDGASFLDDIKYKNFELPDQGIQPKNLASVYDELVSKALAGDVDSARDLAFELYGCSFAHESLDALNVAVKRIEEEKVVVSPNPHSDIEHLEDLSQESADMIDRRIVGLTEDYERCADIPPSQKALSEVDKWAELAADQNDFGAIKLLQMKADRDTTQAVKWLNKSWEVFGDVDALSDMAIHYSMGLNKNSNGQKEPDFQKAYAYNHAYKLIKEASIENFRSEYDDRAMSSFLDAVDRRAAYYGSQLGVAETLSAEALANQLIKNNENCCSSLNWW